MFRKKNRFVLCIFLGILSSAIYFSRKGLKTRICASIFRLSIDDTKRWIYKSNKNSADFNGPRTGFLVDTPNCKIPDLDPHDPSLRGVVKDGVIVSCNNFPDYTYDKGDTVYVDWKVINNSNFKDRFSYCRLIPIIRPVTTTSYHDALSYLPPGPKFNDSSDTGQHDHFHCKCFDSKDRLLFENYHTIMKEKKVVEDRCKEKMAERFKNNTDIKETLNVLIILVDTVSRLNSLRFMKKTTKYLTDVLKATDVAGYNKVGYGTFHNLVPLLTGKFYQELPWSFETPVFFDNFTFVWKDYAANGYRTYFSEDYPFGAVFDYKKPGFRKDPVDYYDRHLFLSMYEQPTEIVYNEENCILSKLQTDWVLDNAYKFLTKFKDKPYFCMLPITRLTHDYLERTFTADAIYYNYLKKLYEGGLLNNTVLFFVADHGIRWGAIREWYIGLMEERLPMLYIVLPPWFRQKYSDRVKNLQTNSRKLTTHFDFYETLQDILFFTGKDRTIGGKSNTGKKRAYSLFNEIPVERSCADADIKSHWCTCSETEIADVKSKQVVNAAQFFADTINKHLENVKHLCEILYVDKIDSAYKIKPFSKTLENKLISQKVTFTAKPGGGKFEGTIEFDARKKTFKLEGEISRINSHAGEKTCDVNYNEERLCYCKANRQ